MTDNDTGINEDEDQDEETGYTRKKKKSESTASIVLKYSALIAPIVALIGMIAGWVYHVESGLRAAQNVTDIREQLNGMNADLAAQRARTANLESLFEPYLIEKKAEELLRKRNPKNTAASIPPDPAAYPKDVKKDAEHWAKSQIERGVEEKK